MSYTAPIRDMMFDLEHLAGLESISGLPGFEDATPDTAAAVLEECGKFNRDVVAPLNRDGDLKPSTWADGKVTTTPGFKQAFRQFVEAGWQGLSHPADFGGQGLPKSLSAACTEMLNSANLSFALCPLLSDGAIEALLTAGSDAQKQRYIPRLISGEWTGTMNLTEPQAGSDVGALTTKAVPNGDGTYAITGQKIYITWGEHDMAEQIVHLVLARTPGAPAGTRGISCFIVPKYILDEDGNPGERNAVTALSIEHKMGIHGSPTCVLNYEGATGYLIGEENMGMRIMFVMMNVARLSVGMQGVALSERAFQQSLAYAKDRRQGLAIGATGKDSAIIEFPDVRRMILTQKASIAAIRRLMLLNASYMDIASHHPDAAERTRATEIVGLLTPICKSFGTDVGNELTSIGLQVHGGMGFIEETGAAQHVRDIRIAAIYEGTNGIQAADLVGRKLGVRDGASVMEFIAQIRGILGDLDAAGADFASIRTELARQIDALETATTWMLRTGVADPNAVLSGSSPYLRMWGLVTSAWLLARSALAAAPLDADTAKEQLVMARFFAEQLLPACAGLLGAATAGSRDLYALDF